MCHIEGAIIIYIARKLNRRRSAKLTVPPSSDARPVVYHSNHQAPSTARFRRVVQLATGDAWF